MSEIRRRALPVGLLTVLLGLVVVFRPVPFGLALRAWLVALGALAASSLVRGALAPYGRLTVDRIHFGSPKPPPAARPAGLEEVERAVDFATWNPADLRRRLRPLLREVAAYRLQAGQGIDLERNPQAAEAVLGATAWSLIAAPTGIETPAGLAAISQTVDRLESI